jgi:tRNA(adenine34) deaminase
MNEFSEQDHLYMNRAIELAKLAEAQGEVPVGAVLVCDSKIIGEGFNSPITLNDPTAHAEILAIRLAAQQKNNYRLPDTTLYVTLEPCAMCAGALVHSRIKRLVFATTDEKSGACGSVFDVITNNMKTHSVQCEHGLYALQASTMLSEFFRRRRSEKKQLLLKSSDN